MPASRSPFLLAGGNGGVGARKRPSSNLSRSFQPTTHPDLLTNATPAPRSFGAGPDSSENTSSLYDSDEEEKMRQDSLFERAKAASTYVTGDTSPPLGECDDEEMSDIVEEDEKALQSSVGQGTALAGHAAAFASSPRATPSRRMSSSTQSRQGVLAGPTFDVAPPRAIRVMGAPPLGRMPIESEAILGVASARIKVVQRTVDDFEAQVSDWKLSGPSTSANRGERDASWPGLDPKGERSIVTREAHIMTLSVMPGERGQGLGARLLDRLLDECKRRTAGPRINLASGSFIPDGDNAAPPRAHQDAPMRTVLEMHPSNTAAMQLYQARHFRQVPGNKGVIKHFFRGDQRIPNNIRVKIGGSDAIRMERIDVPS